MRSSGNTPISMTSNWTEILVTVYITGINSTLSEQVIYKTSLLKSMLIKGVNTRFFVGGYYATVNDYGYCFINAQYNSISIRNFYYGGVNYSNTAFLLIRYR